MARFAFLAVVLSLSIVANAQSTNTKSAAPVQVVYVMDGAVITTYDIDPQTFYANEVGSLAVSVFTYPTIAVGPNGHFLYYTAYMDPSGRGRRLLVFATDSRGVPQNPPVQIMNPTNFYDRLLFVPNTNFMYVVSAIAKPNLTTLYMIWRYLVDPSTGKLSQPESEAMYTLPTDGSGEYCGLTLLGTNAAGTELYDEIACDEHDGNSATYDRLSIDLQSGKLGPEQQVYGWASGGDGGEGVQFIGNLIFDFDIPNDFQQGIDSVNIYPVATNTQPPIVQCTAAMLEACGYSGGVAHPSGEYVFMGISPYLTQIDKVELSEKRIVDTGNYIPYSFAAFSPDGTIVYSYSYITGGYILEIYGFDATTSNVTPGGAIPVLNGLDPYFVAERYQ